MTNQTTCAHCGKPIPGPNAAHNPGQPGVYCSAACANATDHTDRLAAIKARLLANDPTCHYCNGETLVQGGTRYTECPECHGAGTLPGIWIDTVDLEWLVAEVERLNDALRAMLVGDDAGDWYDTHTMNDDEWELTE